MQFSHLDKVLFRTKEFDEMSVGVVTCSEAAPPVIYCTCRCMRYYMEQVEIIRVVGKAEYPGVAQAREKLLRLLDKALLEQSRESCCDLLRDLFCYLDHSHHAYVEELSGNILVLEDEEIPVYEDVGRIIVGTDLKLQRVLKILRDDKENLYLDESVCRPPTRLGRHDLAEYFLRAEI